MTEAATPQRRSSGVLAQVVETLVVLVAFAAAGAGAGWLWERWWTPLDGVVVDGAWVPGYRPDGDLFVFDFPSLQGFFDATAQYVVLGVLAGLVLGVACSLLGRRSELVMLAAVALGSAVASLVAYRLGTHLGPPDPDLLAAGVPDGTVLASELSIKGVSPFVAWPLGSLLGLAATYLLTSARTEAQHRARHDPHWLGQASEHDRSRR